MPRFEDVCSYVKLLRDLLAVRVVRAADPVLHALDEKWTDERININTGERFAHDGLGQHLRT